MALLEKGGQTEETRGPVWHKRMVTAEIIISNAIPVIGVWFLGWEALRPIFFYWLDGLLALWGLGLVAAVITIPEVPIRGSKCKLWLFRSAVISLSLVILSIPSVFTAMYVIASFKADAREVLVQVFSGYAVWFSLLIVFWSYAGQTIGELRFNPSLTIRQTGQERANLFIHRTLLMGFLVFWGNWGQPPRWVLAAYVLAVACLYTYTQLYPQRYLRFIGLKTKTRGGRGSSGGEKKKLESKKRMTKIQ